MSSRGRLPASGAWALFVVLVAGSETQLFRGVVRTADNDPVKRQEVQVEGVSKYTTGDSGEFTIPPSSMLDVDSEVIFHVTNWVVVRPCELRNGRTFLPPPRRLIQIMVLRPRDPRLKSVASTECILGCLIEEEASHFEPKRNQTGTPSASLLNLKLHGFAEQMASNNSAWSSDQSRGTGRSRVLNAAYRRRFRLAPSERFLGESGNASQPDRNEFLTAKAKELGFTLGELTSAINEWTKSVQDHYQRGLAALHEFRYADASRYISQSLVSATGDVIERYVPLARAEYEQGHYPAAESALRKVLAVHERDPIVLNILGLVLAAEAKYADAEPFYKRALEIDRGILGPEHRDVAAITGNLAELYRAQHRYAEAKPLYEQALKIEEEALGPEDPNVATSLNNLALLYHAQGKDAEAIKLYAQAIAIDDKAVASERPQDVATTLSNLADLYRANAMYAPAEELLKRAEEIVLKRLGPEHPAVARVENYWGLLYHAEGKDSDAVPAYKLALLVAEDALGPEHPFVATILDNLGEVYRTEKKYAEAEPFYKQALAIAKKTEPDQLEMGTCLNHLAVLYHAQGNFPQAETFYKQALAIDEKHMQPDDPELAVALGNLGLVYKDEGKYVDAEPLLKRALAINKKALGPDDRALFANLEVLAVTLFQLNRPNEAKAYADQAKRILLNVEAYQAHEQGDDARAESVYRRALASAENALGPRDPEVARELSNLAVVLSAQGKNADAEPLLVRALDIEEKALGPRDPHVATVADDLAAVLRKLGRDAKAKFYEDQAAKIRATVSQ